MNIKKLTIADCGEKLDNAEMRKKQIAMLDLLVSVCRKYGLRYYLSGGTLLGAVRHKGYIPWDDDIDLNMPRPDTRKLIDLAKAGVLGNLELVYDGNDTYDPAVQWMRIYDCSAIIENFYGGRSDKAFYHPIFIDIFPIDGFPENEGETAGYCRKLVLIRKMLGVSWHDHIVGRNFIDKAAHAIGMLPAKAVGYNRWKHLFQNAVRKYDFDQSEYIGVTSTIHYLAKEKMHKEEYLNPVELPFEGKNYTCPGSYDLYLTQLYGDYMQIPPESRRNSGHAFRVYKAKTI